MYSRKSTGVETKVPILFPFLPLMVKSWRAQLEPVSIATEIVDF